VKIEKINLVNLADILPEVIHFSYTYLRNNKKCPIYGKYGIKSEVTESGNLRFLLPHNACFHELYVKANNYNNKILRNSTFG
jgi:hypothetical protein